MRIYASLCRLFPSLKNDVWHVHVNLEHCNLLSNPSLRFWKFFPFFPSWFGSFTFSRPGGHWLSACTSRDGHPMMSFGDSVFVDICWVKVELLGIQIQLFTDCNPCWAKLKGLVLIVFAQDHTDIRCTKDEKGCIFTIVLFGSFES